MNSQRPSRLAVSASCSRSQLSNRGDPQRHQHQKVYRLADALHLRRHHVTRAIARQNRDVALLQPRHHGNMQSRQNFPGIPRTFGGAPSPAAGADEHRIAAPDLHAGLLFPRFNILDVDRRAGLHIRNSFEARNIDQDASRDNSVLISDDVVLHRSLVGNRRLRVSVVHLAVLKRVPQGVHVGVPIVSERQSRSCPWRTPQPPDSRPSPSSCGSVDWCCPRRSPSSGDAPAKP